MQAERNLMNEPVNETEKLDDLPVPNTLDEQAKGAPSGAQVLDFSAGFQSTEGTVIKR